MLDYHLDVFGLIFGSARRPHDGFEPLLQMCGDFNGDGYADLIFDNGDNELRFYWGDAEAGYSKSADLVIDYESALASDLADLNADGKTDLVTYYGHESTRWKSATETTRSGRRPRNLRERQRRAEATPEPEARGPEPESRVKLLISR